jgi:hypothetical protein
MTGMPLVVGLVYKKHETYKKHACYRSGLLAST